MDQLFSISEFPSVSSLIPYRSTDWLHFVFLFSFSVLYNVSVLRGFSPDLLFNSQGYWYIKLCKVFCQIWSNLSPLPYFLLQDVPGAKDYFNRKIKFVTEQMEKIQKIASEKSKLREGRLGLVLVGGGSNVQQ